MQENYTFAKCVENLRFSNFPLYPEAEPSGNSLIKKSMEYAAKNNQLYHLWWHPHNFGINIDKNMSMLEEILSHYQVLSNKYNMQSITMKDIAALYDNKQ